MTLLTQQKQKHDRKVTKFHRTILHIVRKLGNVDLTRRLENRGWSPFDGAVVAHCGQHLAFLFHSRVRIVVQDNILR